MVVSLSIVWKHWTATYGFRKCADVSHVGNLLTSSDYSNPENSEYHSVPYDNDFGQTGTARTALHSNLLFFYAWVSQRFTIDHSSWIKSLKQWKYTNVDIFGHAQCNKYCIKSGLWGTWHTGWYTWWEQQMCPKVSFCYWWQRQNCASRGVWKGRVSYILLHFGLEVRSKLETCENHGNHGGDGPIWIKSNGWTSRAKEVGLRSSYHFCSAEYARLCKLDWGYWSFRLYDQWR